MYDSEYKGCTCEKRVIIIIWFRIPVLLYKRELCFWRWIQIYLAIFINTLILNIQPDTQTILTRVSSFPFLLSPCFRCRKEGKKERIFKLMILRAWTNAKEKWRSYFASLSRFLARYLPSSRRQDESSSSSFFSRESKWTKREGGKRRT